MLKTHPKFLSLIVPVYRQEKTIERNIGNILAELSELSIQYEVVVVIDGMDDKSMERAKKVNSPRVRVIGYQTNHGKGYAVRYGMAHSKGDIIGFLDAGGDIHAHVISMMLEHFKWYSADIIVGSKRHPASRIAYPFPRRVMSIVYQLFVRILFGLNLRDTQAGVKFYRRIVLEDVLPRLLVKQFAFDIEILAVAYRLGYRRIFEAPIELEFTGASSITSGNFWRIIGNTVWDTVAVFYRMRLRGYYDNTNKRKWRYDPELNFRINVG